MAYCSLSLNGHGFKLTVTEQSSNAKTNTSVVKWVFTVTDNGSWYDSYAKCTVNGTVVYNKTVGWNGGFPAQAGSTSGTLTVNHDEGGGKRVYFYLEGYAYSYAVQHTNGYLDLTQLNRSEPTVQTQNRSATSSSITFTMTSNPSASQWAYQYKVDGGSYGEWIYDNTAGSSRTFTINGLESNTTYYVYAAAKNSVNDLWGYENKSQGWSFSITTLGASTIVSAADTMLNTPCSVTWVPLNANFEYDLIFSIKSSSSDTNPWTHTEHVIPGQTTSYTYTEYTIPLNGPANKITISTSGTMTVTLITYDSDGTSQIGNSDSKNFTVTIPSDVKPTLTGVTISPVSANGGTYLWGTSYVKGQSKLQVSFTASGIYGSTITRRIQFGSNVLTPSTNSATSGILNTVGEYTVIVTITDSRGRTVTNSSNSFTVLDYSTPTATITPYTNGPTGLITTTTWNIAPVNNGTSNLNTPISVSISRSVSGGTTESHSITTTQYSGTDEWTQSVSDSGLIYNYTVTITDKTGSYTFQKTISESPIAISRLGGGGGVTFFGEAQEKGLWLVEEGVYKNITYGNANIFYGTCTNSASTPAKTMNCTKFTSENLKAGVVLLVNFTYSNTAASPTLNVNGTGAKLIRRYGSTSAGTTVKTSWRAGAISILVYDGTNWVINSGFDDDTTYSSLAASSGGTAVSLVTTGEKYTWNNKQSALTAMTQTEATTGTATTARSITAKVLHDTIIGASADYVVEQGLTGIWNYRKWNSGVAECWADTQVSITSWTPWGNQYQGHFTSQCFSYPSNFFTSTPQLLVNAYPPATGGLGISGVEIWTSAESQIYHTKDRTPNLYPLRPDTGGGAPTAAYVIFSMQAKGRWK